MKYSITIFWDEASSRYAQENGVENALAEFDTRYIDDDECDWQVETYEFESEKEVQAFRLAVAESAAYSIGEHYMADTKEI